MAHHLEALYVLQFGDVALGGHYRPGGVIVLKSNHVFGGDSGHYYVGTYTVEAESLTVDAKIVKHDPTAGNPFGDTSASFEVDARLMLGEKTMEGTMERRDRPGLQLPLRLIWKEDLP